MTVIMNKRSRTPQKRLQALDKRLSELEKDERLAVDTRKEIRDMRALLPAAMLKSIEMQKLVVKAGVRIVYTALRMQKCGNFPLPEV